MPVEIFNRNPVFFKDKATSNDKTIYAIDFDSQFNDIAGYLNTSIKPVIDNLAVGAMQGVVDSAGALLRNIGDGTTDWAYITLDDYSLPLAKFANITQNVVLVGNGVNVVASDAAAANSVLVSRLGDTPQWRALAGGDIDNDIITGTQIGERVLTIDNFVLGTIVNTVADHSITAAMMNDNIISTVKALDGGITDIVIGPLADQALVTYGSGFRIGANQTTGSGLNAAHLANGVINRSHFSGDKPLNNLAIFADKWLKQEVFLYGTPNYYQYKGITKITYDMIDTSDFKISGKPYPYEYNGYRSYSKLRLNSLYKEMLNQEVLDAFTKKGVLDSDWY